MLTFHFLFGKMLSLFWQFCDIIGQLFIFANGQILKNHLAIWSHCPWPRFPLELTEQGLMIKLPWS